MHNEWYQKILQGSLKSKSVLFSICGDFGDFAVERFVLKHGWGWGVRSQDCVFRIMRYSVL
jgi:hypothetical protein